MHFLPAALLLGLSTIALAWLEFRPSDPAAPILVVFGPGVSETDAAARIIGAGGRVTARGRLGSTLIARGDDPQFFARLREEGAIALIDASGQGLCARFLKEG